MSIIKIKKNGMSVLDINESDSAVFTGNYIGESGKIIIANPEEGQFLIFEECEEGDLYLSVVNEEFIDTRLENIREANITELIVEEI